MSATCLFCFFSASTVRATNRAASWDKEKLPGLAAPWRKTAMEFERLAQGEGACSCGKPCRRRPGLSKILG